MDENQIMDSINKHCLMVNGKKQLQCAIAFKIAKEFNISVSTIGTLCNKNSIKIKNCQIGCF
ncbi:hypothetical protein BJV85_001877 [Clostridium acetobutylicum]|uniref:Uncharacterized protein n=1 Tax=Clostridium acetobutylicum (strain ATCC 824 / DSM 792 / JCM 1419 / IAM 19013 / LMG 5710 / NBRC 13948 / NRRL B-527 / VKM B-1787 / 2291 / W) TaxID=272562 RepID=Q97HL2_CLOAB|nr:MULTISPECIES: hypothetical protein [Clostridium]AAK79958.1 Uncharacterized protein related to hypothetical protein Cj1507c from Campylobacter jejuni [Clostridium acetobutylicum ATCC 824]ADZ21051.1 Conserved hypothetical protein [Clostridium acetobutylicum EA 2018]AEI32121.1 hypothetical protein SMB_G2031 [Clostridium acetobutylicum DSM 1731]AWV79610.1 hypothetical protein DK921_05745 [Clostridium acetobutylicum]MBC2394416.1 hypothetical protein [Clostridium acetobutylicum]